MIRAIYSSSSLIAALAMATCLQGCHPIPTEKTQAYTVSAKKHYTRLEKLNKLGVGVVELGQTLRLILPNDSFFKGTTTEVKPWRKKTLKAIAALVQSYPNSPVTVSGYTDNIYPRKERVHRSLLTAQAITAYLWNHGESMHRVTLKAQATKHSVSSNGSPDGQADNRRVEIYIGLAKG